MTTIQPPAQASDEPMRAAFEASGIAKVLHRSNWNDGDDYAVAQNELSWLAFKAGAFFAAVSSERDEALKAAREWIIEHRPAITLSRRATVDRYMKLLDQIDAAIAATKPGEPDVS